jgi:polygalacturonase
MVRDCTVFHGHGGLTIGSEMSGGVRRVRAEHLTLIGTDIGLRFKSARGRGGIVEDIVVRAVHMLDISDVGIAFDLFYEGHGSSEEEPAVPVTEETPIFRQITLQDVVMSEAKQAIRIRGLPEAPIEALTIERVTAISQTGSEVADVQHLSLREARLMSRHAPVLRITNTRQSVVQGYFEATKKTGAEALLVICGEHTEAVTVQTSQSVEIAEEVRGEVQLADRSRIGGLDVE